VTVDWRSAGLDPVDTALCELALAVVEQPDAPPSPALLRQLARAGVDRATIDEAIAWVDRRDFSSPERHTP
jgi:hypothetical protein